MAVSVRGWINDGAAISTKTKGTIAIRHGDTMTSEDGRGTKSNIDRRVQEPSNRDEDEVHKLKIEAKWFRGLRLFGAKHAHRGKAQEQA